MKKILVALVLFGSFGNPYAQSGATKNKPRSITVYTTAAGTALRLTVNGQPPFRELKQPFETEPCVFVDPSRKFQSFIGIGAALTDASAETFAKLNAEQQQELLTAYFDSKNGIGYTLGRTNIHSCDFSSSSYTYVRDNDTSLKSFSVSHDEQYRIPFIKRAIVAAGGKLTLYASPWSPPAWMKDNNNMLQGGKLKPSCMKAWAEYYVKFIQAYEAKGIPVWGLTVQNEPMAKQKWESCIFTAEEERDFIKKYLGPTLQQRGMSSKKLIAWDHNRDLLYQRAHVILSDPGAARYVWGVGFHWYETWTGGPMQFDNLKLVNELFPDKPLIFTEGCADSFNMDSISSWSLGEKYGYSMINDFNNGTVAWTDWNILLDEQGGPNHVGNFCFAPVHADTKTGKLIYTNSYYYIGHFSKFIRPGAKRIAVSSSRSQLQATGFANTDGSIIVVVLNTTDKKLAYNVWLDGQAGLTESLPHSISTVVIK